MEEGRGECIFEVGLGSEPPGSNESCDAEDSEQASGKTGNYIALGLISKFGILSTRIYFSCFFEIEKPERKK